MFSLIPCAIMGTLGVWAVFLQTFEGRTFMDPMYTQNNYEHEVDLKDLIFAILHQWKPILVIAIAFAVLANETVCCHFNNAVKATGAEHPVVMGKISF